MRRAVLVLVVAAASLVGCGCESIGLSASVGFNIDGWHVGLSVRPLVFQELEAGAGAAATQPSAEESSFP
jgi:hypothetical protein